MICSQDVCTCKDIHQAFIIAIMITNVSSFRILDMISPRRSVKLSAQIIAGNEQLLYKKYSILMTRFVETGDWNVSLVF